MRRGVALAISGGVLALVGLAPTAAMAVPEDITFTAGGTERHAVLEVPDSTKPLPVVMVFPREGMTAADAITRFQPAVTRAGAAIVALDALPCSRLGGAPCWAPMEAADRQAMDIAATAGLMNDLDTRKNLDTTRLIALGESSGAAFAITATRSLPSRVDGALAISAFDPTRSVVTNAEGQVAFPLALTGPSKIKQQKTMQAITVVRGSADTSIPPQLSREVQVRLATHGWKSKATLITVGGVGTGDPALAAPARISPRIKALLQSALHLDTTMGVQKRLSELGYLPAGTTSSDYGISQAIMAFQGWEGLPRDGVAGASTQTAMLTATRPTATKPGQGKRVEVDIEKQVLLLEQGSKVIRIVHVSTGAAGNTPRGNYSIIRKENPSWDALFNIWLPYASYFIGGFALHEYPDVPGYPASHGCVRISSPFAPGVYDFAGYGTPVYLH